MFARLTPNQAKIELSTPNITTSKAVPTMTPIERTRSDRFRQADVARIRTNETAAESTGSTKARTPLHLLPYGPIPNSEATTLATPKTRFRNIASARYIKLPLLMAQGAGKGKVRMSHQGLRPSGLGKA